jgi:hypothetical protein
MRDMAVDVVELVALHLDDGDHVKEHLVQVHEAALKVLNEMTGWGNPRCRSMRLRSRKLCELLHKEI